MELKQVQIDASTMAARRVINMLVRSFVFLTCLVSLICFIYKDNVQIKLWTLAFYVTYLFVAIIVALHAFINSAVAVYDIKSKEFFEKEGFVAEKYELPKTKNKYYVKLNLEGSIFEAPVPELMFEELEKGRWVKAVISRDRNKKEELQSLSLKK